MTHVRTGTCLLFLISLFCVPVWAQFGIPAKASAAATQPEAPKDALGRSTPRSAVLGFLSAAREGDYELAARYLNTRRRGKSATDLARQLFVVLDRRLPARLNQLSNEPEGLGSDPLRPNQELVGKISSGNRNVDILLERLPPKSGSVWLFSSKTLDSIPDLYEEINVVSVDNVLPAYLVNTRFGGIPLFQWLAVFVGLPLFYLLTALVNRLLSRLVGLLRRRLYRKADLPNPEALPKPIRILLLVFVIRWLLTKLSLPLLPRQFWSSAATILTIAGCVWLTILVNSRVEQYIRPHLRGRNRTLTISMLRLAHRSIDMLVIFAGLVVTLRHFGVNPTAALAGLGIGGIAIALAAQKTLENVIGGISLIFDDVAHVGDFLNVGDTLGTVEDIGLRSTRIRTLDRSVVSVPNGHIANMTLENLTSRDGFWFHPILCLRHGTNSMQVQAVLDGIRSLLQGNQHVKPDSVRVRFFRFGLSSLDVEVFAYFLARDWNHFLEIQEAVLLRIMECIEAAGVQSALPSQAIFVATASTLTDGRMEGLLKVPTPHTKTSDQATANSA